MAIQDLAGNYGLLPDYLELPQPASGMGGQGLQVPGMGGSMPTLGAAPMLQAAPMMPPETMAAPAPIAATPLMPQISPQTGRLDLPAMLGKYFSAEGSYGEEIAKARGVASAETAAFNDMLARAIEAQGTDTAPSKAEMYFRLAAAFGKPTRTGAFTESLGEVGSEMAKMEAEERAARTAGRQTKLQLGLEGQKAKMAAAKEDVATLRALAAEEMKDRRALTNKLLEEYVASGKPQSAAGKQALDEGLRPGTPEFQKRVAQISEIKIEQQMANINAMMGNLAVSQAGLALRQQQASKLSAPEVKMKRETEDSLAAINSAMNDISQAYKLNPNSFDTSSVDKAKRIALETAGIKDPKLIATRTLENLLKSEMITSAAEKMKGVLSDSDIKLLQSIQGLDAKSIEERSNILRNAYTRLQNAKTRQQRRLEDINSGIYGKSSGELE